MEPHNYTALVTDDSFELWGPVQDPERAIDAAAKVAGLPVNKGKMNYALLGGGFGRKGLPDYVIQAVQIAKAMKGTPVKMLWTREETTRHGFYRPSTLAKLVGGLDAAGNLNAWTYRIVAQSPLGFMSWAGAEVLLYVVPNVTVDFSLRNTHVPLGPFRGVGYTQNCFFHQCFLDELAVVAGKDAYTFQRGLLDPDKIPANADNRDDKVRKTANIRRVMDEVVKKAEWTKPLGPNRGRGLAIEEEAGSHVGVVVEVTLDGVGWFKVDRVVIAADTGYLVNPDNATSQLEGSVAF